MGREKQGDRGGEAGRWGWGSREMGMGRWGNGDCKADIADVKKKQYLCGLIRWRVERETIWRRESETIQS